MQLGFRYIGSSSDDRAWTENGHSAHSIPDGWVGWAGWTDKADKPGQAWKVRLKATHAVGASLDGARVWHVKVRQNILSRQVKGESACQRVRVV